MAAFECIAISTKSQNTNTPWNLEFVILCRLDKGLASTCFDNAQHKSLSQGYLKICCLSGAEVYNFKGKILTKRH